MNFYKFSVSSEQQLQELTSIHNLNRSIQEREKMSETVVQEQQKIKRKYVRKPKEPVISLQETNNEPTKEPTKEPTMEPTKEPEKQKRKYNRKPKEKIQNESKEKTEKRTINLSDSEDDLQMTLQEKNESVQENKTVSEKINSSLKKSEVVNDIQIESDNATFVSRLENLKVLTQSEIYNLKEDEEKTYKVTILKKQLSQEKDNSVGEKLNHEITEIIHEKESNEIVEESGTDNKQVNEKPKRKYNKKSNAEKIQNEDETGKTINSGKRKYQKKSLDENENTKKSKVQKDLPSKIIGIEESPPSNKSHDTVFTDSSSVVKSSPNLSEKDKSNPNLSEKEKLNTNQEFITPNVLSTKKFIEPPELDIDEETEETKKSDTQDESESSEEFEDDQLSDNSPPKIIKRVLGKTPNSTVCLTDQTVVPFSTSKPFQKEMKSRFRDLEYCGFFYIYNPKYTKITCNNDIFLFLNEDDEDVIRGPVSIEYVRELMKFKSKAVRYHPYHHFPRRYYDSQDDSDNIFLVYVNSKKYAKNLQ
jgi:hypothetical protein